MMRSVKTYGPFEPDRPLLVLGHGAGAGQAHPWMQGVATGLSERGITVVTFDFPYMQAGRRLPDRGPVLEAAFQSVWTTVARDRDAAARCFAGGKSMGGRIATQAAAKELLDPPPSGVVCFGYPLHPPGKPDTRRDAHLGAIGRPILFLHGTRDPFGTPDEMTDLVSRLSDSTLHIVDGGDHSLERSGDKKKPRGSSLTEVLDRAAEWMKTCPMMP
jgi:uncharacterized protein